MKKTLFGVGVVLALCALTGCAALEEMRAQIEARQKEEAQRRAEERRRFEEMRLAEEKRLTEKLRRRDGESMSAWIARAKKNIKTNEESKLFRKMLYAEKKRLAEEKRLTEEKRRAEEMRLAEEKRLTEKLRRRDGENISNWIDRVGKIIKTEEETALFRKMVDAEEKRVAEEKRLAEEKRRAEEERQLNDPKYKYPYTAHSAGIELCPGLRSGVSLGWFVKSGNRSLESETTIENYSLQEGWVKLSRRDYRGILFKFELEPRASFAYKGKKKGGLISIWKVEKDSPDQLQKVIARYMNAYPGLKHSRTSRNESKKFTNDQGITYDIKNILFMDKLESEKVEIVIESRKIDVKASGHRSEQELQFFADATMVSLAPQMALQVTITDKVLEKYFSTLRSAPAVK